MSDSKLMCDPGVIGRFLANALSSADLQDFERHLDSCECCRKILTEAAADGDWWSEARGSLINDEDDVPRELAETLSFLNPSDNPRMMGRFGGYEIAGLIGQGGMGIVLKGFDESLNRYAAIKVLAPQLATRGSARTRFAREAQAAAAVVHDNVIAIHGVSEAAGLPFLVMPYIRGESLQKRLDRQGPMNPTEIVRIAHQVASGLAAANKQGLVHRDIKPANILLPEGIQRVLITDFGLARAVDDSNLTGTGTIAGTPQFMSPEQARGDAVDPRSDLFSLGTVIYAMCTGRSPFRASSPYGVLRRIIEDTPRGIREINSEIPYWLEAIVQRLHSKQPDDRFQSAGELAELLEKCLAHLQNPSLKLPHELQRAVLRPGRRKVGVAVGVCLLLGAVGFGLSNVPGFVNFGIGDHPSPNLLQEKQQEGESSVENPVVEEESASATQEESAGTAQEDEIAGSTQEQETADAIEAEAAHAAYIESRNVESRKRLKRLNLRLKSLREEGAFVGSLAVEKEILLELKMHDQDHQLLANMREEMIDLRLAGEHEEANRVVEKMQTVESALADRYRQLDRIYEMEEQIAERLEPLKSKAEDLELKNRPHDDVAKAYERADKVERQLEAEYRMATSKTKSSQEYQRINSLLDARIAYYQAAVALENREETFAQGGKLLARGFVTQQQVETDKIAVRVAKLRLRKAENLLRQFGGEEVIDAMSGKSVPGLELFGGESEERVAQQAKLAAAMLEAKLIELQTRYGEEHAEVMECQQKIDFWKGFLRNLKNEDDAD